MDISLLQKRKTEEVPVKEQESRECGRFRRYRSILEKEPVYAAAVERVEKEMCLGLDTRLYLYVMAPVLTGFVSWVLDQAVAAGKRRLYFLSRDGYQMYLVALRLVKSRRLSIECRYLYVSRYAVRVPEYHLDLQKGLDRICVDGIDVTLERILRRAALTEREARELAAQIGWEDRYRELLNYRQIQELKQELGRHGGIFPYMERHSRAAYENAMGYLRQEGLFENVPYAIVDSGWTGTLQESMQNLIRSGGVKTVSGDFAEVSAVSKGSSVEISSEVSAEISLEGYYFGLYELPVGADLAAYHAYYFEPGKGLRRKINFSNSLFETICSAEEGMVVGYAKEGGRYIPRLETAYNANRMQIKRNLETLERFLICYEKVQGCEEHGRQEKLESCGKREDCEKQKICEEHGKTEKGKQLAEYLLTLFMAHPAEMEVEAYGNALFSDDVLEGELKRAAAELTEEEIRNKSLLRKLCIVAGLKKAQIYESAWIEGSIVRCGRHTQRHLRSVWRYKFFVYVRKNLRTHLNTSQRTYPRASRRVFLDTSQRTYLKAGQRAYSNISQRTYRKTHLNTNWSTGEKQAYTHEENKGRASAILFCHSADGGAGGKKKICPVLPGNRMERAEPIAVNGSHVADLFHHL